MKVAIKLSIDRMTPEGKLLQHLNKEGVLSRAFEGRSPELDSQNGRMLLFTADLSDPALGSALRNIGKHVSDSCASEMQSWETLKMKLLATWWEGKMGRSSRREH